MASWSAGAPAGASPGAPPSASPLVLRFAGGTLWALDQYELPWRECRLELRDAEQVASAIRRLAIRGAPLIGVAAAYGVALDLARHPSPDTLERACRRLRDARPTAVNLAAAVDRVQIAVKSEPGRSPAMVALEQARRI